MLGLTGYAENPVPSEKRMAADSFEALLELMATLRGADGCPWDRKQTARTLKPYVIEEAHEVIEAVDSDDPDRLRDELGDLLFQVVFQARIGEEKGQFTTSDVCAAIVDKMRRRHPHVFGDQHFESADEVHANWEQLKARERKAKGERSVLAGVPSSMPSLTRAFRLSDKAAKVGFDWPDISGVLAKVHEEADELAEARGETAEALEHEYGDLLFALANMGRFIDIHPEEALRAANERFIQRFHHIERDLARRGVAWEDATLDEMEDLWQLAKQQEQGRGS